MAGSRCMLLVIFHFKYYDCNEKYKRLFVLKF